MAFQKKPQEDGRGGEGGTADKIRGEVGSIPTYPTYIPPGPKKFFCRVSWCLPLAVFFVSAVYFFIHLYNCILTLGSPI